MSNRIYIDINDLPRADDKKTAALPSKRRWRPGRRRRTGRIRFYDLASVTTGPAILNFTELDYDPIIPAFASRLTYGDPSSGSNVYSALGFLDYSDLVDAIFATPVDEWRTHYKKIVPEMNYGIDVTRTDVTALFEYESELLSDSNPNFTDEGLKPSATFFDDYLMVEKIANYTVITPRFFLCEHPDNHITATQNFTDDAVSFTPSANMDVFLMPSMVFVGAQCWLTGSPVTYNNQHLSDYFMIYPRRAIYDTLHPLYQTSRGFNWSGTKRPPEGFFHTSAAYITAEYQRGITFAEWLKTLPDARGTYSESTSGPGDWTFTDDGSYFNTGVASTPNANTFYYSAYATANPATLVYLRAVVHQNGNWFYIWNSGWL